MLSHKEYLNIIIKREGERWESAFIALAKDHIIRKFTNKMGKNTELTQ